MKPSADETTAVVMKQRYMNADADVAAGSTLNRQVFYAPPMMALGVDENACKPNANYR
jgi:hypothetical protein